MDMTDEKRDLEALQSQLEEQEARLKAREEELDREEERQRAERERLAQLNLKERMYEKVKVPVKYLDIFIGLCVAAIVVCVILGMLKGRGII